MKNVAVASAIFIACIAGAADASQVSVFFGSQAGKKPSDTKTTTISVVNNTKLLSTVAYWSYNIRANTSKDKNKGQWSKFSKNDTGVIVGDSNTLSRKDVNFSDARGSSNAWAQASGQGLLPSGNNGYRYKATVSGGGALSPNPGKNPKDLRYNGMVKVVDPFDLTYEDIAAAGLDYANFDLVVPFTIDSIDLGAALGSVPLAEMLSLSSFMTTAGGTLNPIEIEIGHLFGVEVTGSAGFTHYFTDSSYQIDTSVDTPFTLAELQDRLYLDLLDDGILSAPINIGSLYSGLSLSGPTSPTGSDTAVSTGGENGFSTANSDIGYTPVPVPAAAWTFGSLILGMTVMSRRRRQST